MQMEQTDSEDMVRALASYRKTGGQEFRNQLVVHYLPIVRPAAVQLRAMTGSFLKQEDLADQGVLILMEYLDRYNPDRGARFEAYAFMRVRGSMIDYMHSQDWVPHRARNFQKRVDQVFSILSHEKMGEPDVKEVAGYPNLPVEKVKNYIKYMNHVAVLSFESVLQDMTAIFAKGELEAGGMDGRPEESLHYKELMEMLTTAINGLEEKEWLIITLYCYGELKYSEVAEVVGVEQSCVCQVHTKAIGKLKNCLEGYMRG